MGKVNLSAEEQALLTSILELTATDVREKVTRALSADSESLRAAIGRVERQARLLGALEHGVLEVDSDLVEMFEEWRSSVLNAVEYENSTLRKLRAGDMGWCHDGMSPPESERETLRYVDSLLDEVNACDSLLDRGAVA